MLLTAVAALSLTGPALAQEATPIPSPGEIAAAAPASDWIVIDPSDLLVMELAPDAKGKPRRVVVQLMPAPFSQSWIGNIRKLAAAHWWDGTSVNRVQDNYVAQWGDATEKKALPAGLAVVPESDYVAQRQWRPISDPVVHAYEPSPRVALASDDPAVGPIRPETRSRVEGYAVGTGFVDGWAVAGSVGTAHHTGSQPIWPVHCYGMVGVGRNMSPDTGSGAELYAVIGHAPRHLDRNIALVGRVISGIEYLSSLPRGTEALGFYKDEAERTPITSIRIAGDLPAAEQPKFEYLSTESDSFARYADARANRRDPFFITPAGGADICNIPVPVRQIAVK
jgi:cyclophilin family peptidyl-prolyl cis-trans isomerase